MTPSPAVRLAQDLIRCRSVTPDDGGALPLLAARLTAGGFAAELVTLREPGTPDVLNLYARIGTGAPCLLFNGHTDVVPPGDTAGWRCDPFEGRIEEGLLIGRGACDMKSGVAAFVTAALAHGLPQRGSIAILITGDEEGPAINGTARMLERVRERGERFEACLVGEPTNVARLGDTIKNGRRGSLTGVLTVHGRQGHVAYPALADNPLPHLLRLLGALTETPLDAGTAAFDPSNLEIVTIDTGNPAANVIPGEARARFNIRFNDRWTPATLRDEVQARLHRVAGPARYGVDFQPCNAVAFLTPSGPFTTLVADAIEAETGLRPALSTTGGTSDARFIAAHAPVVEFGLVGTSMHAVDEHTAIADIDALTAIYGRIIARVLAA